MYSCAACNRIKGKKWPSEKEQLDGKYFLNPCIDDYVEHMKLLYDNALEWVTTPGEFTGINIGLNRPGLIILRRERHKLIEKKKRLVTLFNSLVKLERGLPVELEKSKKNGEIQEEFQKTTLELKQLKNELKEKIYQVEEIIEIREDREIIMDQKPHY